MANARLSALLSRRSNTPYSSSGKIRLLSPANTSLATIAKKTVTSELNIMQANYNAGLVSNSDFKDFLSKMLITPGVSDTDKNDIQTQIADFESRIVGDKLTQAYKSAPDNTLQQVQAAQALASYFRQRASGMQPDTPAYNDNVNNAIGYEQKVQSINDNVQKIARQNQRYVLEQQVNKIPSGTSENANAKADMWSKLYNQAIADGDTTAANQYAANYQQELTNADTLGTKESDKANKKTVSDFIATTLNDYHTGKISGDDALAQLQSAAQFATDSNDITTLTRLNGLSETINREIDKGVVYSASGGLSVKGKGGGGSTDLYLNPDGSVSYGGGSPARAGIGTKITSGNVSGTNTSTNGKTNTFTNGNTGPKSFSQLDLEYKNELIAANKALTNGQITPQQYQQSILLLTKSRQLDLQNITQGLTNIVTQNPNAKLGKALISNILDDYTKELGGVTAEHNGIKSGNLVLTMSTQNVENPAGTKFTTPQLQFVSKDKLPKDSVNAGGIYYPTRFQDVSFTDQNLANQYVKTHPNTKVAQDSTGNFVIQDQNGGTIQQQYLDVTDTGGHTITYENDPKYGYIPVSVGPQTDALRKQIIKEADQAISQGKTYKQNLMNYNDLSAYKPGQPAGVTSFPAPKPPNPVQSAISSVVPAVQGAANEVIGAVAPLATPGAPNLEAAPAPSLGITPSMKVSTPKPVGISTPVSASAPAQTAIKTGTTNLSVAGAKPATTIPVSASPTQKPVAIAAPPKIANLPTTKPKDVSIGGSLKALGNNLLGWTGLKF